MSKKLDFRSLLLKLRRANNYASAKFAVLQRLAIIALIILFLVWLNFGFIVELLTSESNIKKDFEETLSEVLERDIKVNGEVVFKTKPEPYLELNQIRALSAKDEDNGELEEESDEENEEEINFSEINDKDFLSISRISLNPTLSSVASGDISFDEIKIEGVKIIFYSEESSTEPFQNFISKLLESDFFEDSKISFKDLEIKTYKKSPISNNYISRSYIFPELEIMPDFEGVDIAMKGIYEEPNINEEFLFQIGFDSNITSSYALKGKVYSDDSELSLSGEISDSDSKLEVSGTISAFNRKLFSILGFSQSTLDRLSIKDKAQIELELIGEGNNVKLNKFTANSKSINFEARGNISGNEKSDVSLNLTFNKLLIPELLKSDSERLSSKKVQEVENNYDIKLSNFILFSLGEDINLDISLNAPDILFFEEKKGSADIKLKLVDNKFTVEKSEIRFPGNSSLKIVSAIDIEKEEKKLKGRLDFAFKAANFYEFIKATELFDNPDNFKKIDNFAIKSNGYLYDRNIHFRKISVKVKRDRVAGQVLIDYSKNLSASSAFNMPIFNINKYYTPSNKVAETPFLQSEESFSKRLDLFRTIDSFFDELNLILEADKVVLENDEWNNFSAFINTTPGMINLKDSYFENESLGSFEGKILVDVRNFQPKLNYDFSVENLDLNKLMGDKKSSEDLFEPFTGQWNKDRISLDHFRAYEGKGILKATNVKYGNFEGEDFKLFVEFLGDQIKINKSRLKIYGSKVDFEGRLATEFPAFNLSFVAADVNSQEFLNNVFGIGNINGKINMSGVLGSSGFSISEMVGKLKGRVTIVSKQIDIEGFNLVTLSKALPLVKRREQAADVSQRLLRVGKTSYPSVTAVISVINGRAKFDAVNVKSNISEKYLVRGGFDLYNWNTNMSVHLVLNTKDKMDVKYNSSITGPIHNFEAKWNVEDANKYWETKFYSGKI